MTAQIFKVLDRDYRKVEQDQIKQELPDSNSENQPTMDVSPAEPHGTNMVIIPQESVDTQIDIGENILILKHSIFSLLQR